MYFASQIAVGFRSLLTMGLGVLVVTLVLGTIPSWAGAISSFESGPDGWVGTGPASQYSWQAMGGNPGGYMDFIDRDSVGGQLSAPAKFLGSWSTLDGVGHLSWDSIVIDESFSPTAVPFRVFISGPGGSAHVFPTANQGVWHTWVTTIVPINQGDWTIDSGTWAGLLANVTDLRVQIERVSNAGSFSVFGPGDRDGVDNVFLGTPVPEPSTWILLAAGLVGLGGYGWRCRQ